MSKEIEIKRNIELVNILQFAEEVITAEGNTYYHFPQWIQMLPNRSFIFYEEMPNDLSMFITKEGLGGDNPKRTKVKL